MITWLIWSGSVIVYVGGWACHARRFYQRHRFIDGPDGYRQPQRASILIESDNEAAGWGAARGLIWFLWIPGELIARGAAAFIKHNPPELPQERDNRLRDLERRNAELERQLHLRGGTSQNL
jgi:hypothetical protein